MQNEKLKMKNLKFRGGCEWRIVSGRLEGNWRLDIGDWILGIKINCSPRLLIRDKFNHRYKLTHPLNSCLNNINIAF